MPWFEVFRADFLPTVPNSERCSEAVVLRPSADDLIAAMFSGPWFDTAAKAFSSVAAFQPTERFCEAAFAAAATAVDHRWRALSDDDRFAQGWSGTAYGAVLHVKSDSCECSWLGDNQVFHLRSHSILAATSPHTLYQGQKDHGNENPDVVWKNVCTRWLSPEHSPDTVKWSVQNGDLILIRSSYIDETLIPTRLDRFTPQSLAEEIVNAAGKCHNRRSHCVLAIAVRESKET